MAYYCFHASIFIILGILTSNSIGQIIVNTDKGLVRGTTELVGQTTLHKYLGIPFAEPPIGVNRFKPSRPLNSSWPGVLNATKYSSSCIQFVPVFRSPLTAPESIINENCLYLNVFTTAPSIAGNKSVMVWIHGGGYIGGSGANWQPQTLAVTEDIVVVTMNYRLGIFGFTTSGEANANSRSIQANLGFLDQQLAMAWVQNNIEQFGGKKDAVTLAGFSAGSFAVGIHLVAPSSSGLYRYAIMESGTILDGRSVAEARATFLRIGQVGQCNTSNLRAIYQCINKYNSTILLQIQFALLRENPANFGLVIDGRFLNENPRKLLQDGRFFKGRLLIGTTLQDGYSFIPPLVTRQVFLGYVSNWFREYPPSARASVINRYTDYTNIDSPTVNRMKLGELSNDALFLSTSDFMAQKYSKHAPTYNYVWTYHTQQDIYLPAYMGVTHSMDVPYFYGYPVQKPAYYLTNFTTAEAQLSRDSMKMWGNFIHTGLLTYFTSLYSNAYRALPTYGLFTTSISLFPATTVFQRDLYTGRTDRTPISD
ncbi:uncharacterized protein TRIADDRAFT_61106 [Trichoplax adhaerens]|uniref:Carboxylic ester hydrolase n=1 Tax=Trichoplax adhaerens TaxID=10228 RepID=B3SA22_TRIAD|nr:hypothetical protein TRIADDRAFT_61106 [Trichoplax adhaerens]EDV20438.1 hypothetical protein TRIADDRAFT_61106 [Trichoplax adhaerens]|eukprot:XP_002117132.1 hypothetical protein TRIADDRAFT_61106 [Trichoplax adhaerens]